MGGGLGKEAARCECNAVCTHIKGPSIPMHLPHCTHLSICLSTYTKRKSAHSRPMAAMRASGKRLCQMVLDAGLRHGTEDCLQTVFVAGWWMASVDANYDSQLDQMIVATTNKFTVLKKLVDDIAVLVTSQFSIWMLIIRSSYPSMICAFLNLVYLDILILEALSNSRTN